MAERLKHGDKVVIEVELANKLSYQTDNLWIVLDGKRVGYLPRTFLESSPNVVRSGFGIVTFHDEKTGSILDSSILRRKKFSSKEDFENWTNENELTHFRFISITQSKEIKK